MAKACLCSEKYNVFKVLKRYYFSSLEMFIYCLYRLRLCCDIFQRNESLSKFRIFHHRKRACHGRPEHPYFSPCVAGKFIGLHSTKVAQFLITQSSTWSTFILGSLFRSLILFHSNTSNAQKLYIERRLIHYSD